MRERYPRFRHVQHPRSRRRDKPGIAASTPFLLQVLGLSLITGFACWHMAPGLTRTWQLMTLSDDEFFAREKTVYYRDCSHARAAGAAPIHRGEPGYREAMDGDHDGIACEPYSRW